MYLVHILTAQQSYKRTVRAMTQADAERAALAYVPVSERVLFIESTEV